MMTDVLSKHLTSLSFPLPDLRHLEDFHEATKINDVTIQLDGVWVGNYLVDPRALLETARNRKRSFLSQAIELPEPGANPALLTEAMQKRKTTAAMGGEAMSLATLSTMLAASMKTTRKTVVDGERGLEIYQRPYASGGGLYPVEVYPILLNVDGVEPTVTRYDPVDHRLVILKQCESTEDILGPLSDFANQLSKASVIFIFSSVFPRTTVKYGNRGYRYALIEAGEIAQNLSLMAEAEELKTLPWGGFFDDDVADLIGVDGVDEGIVHCLAVGK
jgi:SagB-type dehydrogenase family enzyme